MDTVHVTTWPWHHSQRAKAFVVGSVHQKQRSASVLPRQWTSGSTWSCDVLTHWAAFFPLFLSLSLHLNAFELRPRTISITIILIMRAKLHISPCRYRGTLRQKSFFRSWNAANSRSRGKSECEAKIQRRSLCQSSLSSLHHLLYFCARAWIGSIWSPVSRKRPLFHVVYTCIGLFVSLTASFQFPRLHWL